MHSKIKKHSESSRSGLEQSITAIETVVGMVLRCDGRSARVALPDGSFTSCTLTNDPSPAIVFLSRRRVGLSASLNLKGVCTANLRPVSGESPPVCSICYCSCLKTSADPRQSSFKRCRDRCSSVACRGCRGILRLSQIQRRMRSTYPFPQSFVLLLFVPASKGNRFSIVFAYDAPS